MATGADQDSQLGFTEILGLRTRYRLDGAGVDVLVLHGWGAKIETVAAITQGLAASARLLSVDLPGFGETEGPPKPWGAGDYADWVLALLDAFKLQRVSIIGHSNGGRVAIQLAARHPHRVERLLLVDSAGIRPRRGPKYYAKVYSAKTVKHLAPRLGPLGARMQRRIAARLASSDYAAAGALRPTFVRLVNEDLSPLLPGIKAPTLLIWGENDTATPVSDGQRMERLIPDAALIVFKGAGHYSYLDDPGRFNLIAAHFLSEAREGAAP